MARADLRAQSRSDVRQARYGRVRVRARLDWRRRRADWRRRGSPVVFALGTREHFFDVIEASDETWPEVEPLRPELVSLLLGTSESVQAAPEDLVHDRFQRDAPFASLPFQPHGHIIIDGERGAHVSMLPI